MKKLMFALLLILSVASCKKEVISSGPMDVPYDKNNDFMVTISCADCSITYNTGKDGIKTFPIKSSSLEYKGYYVASSTVRVDKTFTIVNNGTVAPNYNIVDPTNGRRINSSFSIPTGNNKTYTLVISY